MQEKFHKLAKKGITVLPKKFCNYMGCNKIINYSEKYCDEHKNKSTSRHKTYDKFRRDKKAADFYHSDEWIKTREFILNRFNYIDIYAYYVEGKILVANTVHHIIELNDDWNKRLDLSNLIPLSDSSHNIIHVAYKTNKVETQKLLIELRNKFINEFVNG
jgi:5-methylcytosine-specific restriction endonuclease McrA